MVCPYCSTDMEPIELNGKVFCSNCGLTIKTLTEPTRLDPNASIVSGYKDPSTIDVPKNDFPAFPDENPLSENRNMNPLTDGAKEELGISVVHPENDVEITNPIQTEPEAASSDISITTNDQLVDLVTPELTPNDSQTSVEPITDQAEGEVASNDIESIIKTLSQAELSTHKPLHGDINSEQIKEIESLAAGGILLDILSDDLTQKEDEAEVKVLDAAKKLVKHIKPADISNANASNEKKSEEAPEPSQVLAKETIEDKAKTEAEIKEIEEKIHDLAEKSFEVTDKDIKKYDPDALDMAHLKIEHKTSRIMPNNNDIKETIKAAILPSSDSGTDQVTSESQSENVTDDNGSITTSDEQPADSMPNPDNETETNQQAVTIPAEAPEIEIPKTLISKPKSKKRFSFIGLFKSNRPKKEKLSKKAEQKSLHEDAKIKVESKSSHVSPDYFKKIIETNRVQKHISKPEKRKNKLTKKSAKSNNKKMAILYTILGLVGLFVIVSAIFMLSNSTKPEAQIERATSSVTFNTKKPNYIPEGYILSGASFEKADNIYKLEYTFATDKTRQIIFIQTKQPEPVDYINNLVKSNYKDKEYTQKTISEQDYTEVAKYTILWNRAEMVYSINATNTIMDNNLLYKMAESIE